MTQSQQQQTNTSPVQQQAAVVRIEKDITDSVLKKVEMFRQSGELKIPADYSPENAIKAAYLILSDPKDNLMTTCTRESIANSLLKMVVWGLSPLKKQCDFIKYGNTLECTPEYTGNIVLAKRYGGLKWIHANAIYAGDEFAFAIDATTGRKKILKHEQTLESIGSKDIKGAYAVYQLLDGTTNVEIMNIDQIRQSWAMGGSKGVSPAHKNFPDEMAKKTVINRACKLLIRGSDDSVLFSEDEASETRESRPQDTTLEAQTAETIGFKEATDASFEEVPQTPPTPAQTESPANAAEMQETAAQSAQIPF